VRKLIVTRLTPAERGQEHGAGVRAARSWLHRRKTEDLAVILSPERSKMQDDELRWLGGLSVSIRKQAGGTGSPGFWFAFWGVLEAEFACR
jgi:hypothetical protein